MKEVGSPNLLFENMDLKPIQSIFWKGLHREGAGKPVMYDPVGSSSFDAEADSPDPVHEGLGEAPQKKPIPEAHVRIG